MAYNFLFNIRCKMEDLVRFKEWCKTLNINHQDMIRKFIKGGPDGSVKISISPEANKKIKELYDEH